MEPKVIFEDKQLLVLDKPTGWIVNEAFTTKNTPVVQTWLKRNLKYPLVESQNERSGIVHRLDKETSGILLVAKTKEAFEYLQTQFRSREVEKTYIALVHGKFALNEGEIRAPVGRLPWNRERFGVLPGGREATTRYRVISNYHFSSSNEKFSLVTFFPKTGRTHQIRIHAKYLGCPIVSDDFYAGRKTAKKDKKWCPRLFLHASEISFKHPRTDKKLTINSDLPDDLETALASLEKLQ